MNETVVPDAAAGTRLDVWLSQDLPAYSRARWQALIKQGLVRVDGVQHKAHHPLAGGERITYTIPPPEPVELQPESIELSILYEDTELIVVNKPAGLVVHPAPGHRAGTLVNALLHHCKDLAGIGGELRPGIVHRLDKDTSGVLVVAKNAPALAELQRQFKSRSTRKEYLALVQGIPKNVSGTIETHLGRHPRDRKKMSAEVAGGKLAVTHYEVAQTYGAAALLKVRIETGRTHQIRVHMAFLGHPVLGDRLYGRSRSEPISVPRQMLHASTLALNHPDTGKAIDFEAPMPEDFRNALRKLGETVSG